MSFHDLIILYALIFLLLLSLTKWSKSLVLIINLELITILILALYFLQYSAISLLLITLLVFLVGEALILLSSLFCMIQFVGETYSPLFVY